MENNQKPTENSTSANISTPTSPTPTSPTPTSPTPTSVDESPKKPITMIEYINRLEKEKNKFHEEFMELVAQKYKESSVQTAIKNIAGIGQKSPQYVLDLTKNIEKFLKINPFSTSIRIEFMVSIKDFIFINHLPLINIVKYNNEWMILSAIENRSTSLFMDLSPSDLCILSESIYDAIHTKNMILHSINSNVCLSPMIFNKFKSGYANVRYRVSFVHDDKELKPDFNKFMISNFPFCSSVHDTTGHNSYKLRLDELAKILKILKESYVVNINDISWLKWLFVNKKVKNNYPPEEMVPHMKRCR